jgi:anti-anti-sigma factor
MTYSNTLVEVAPSTERLHDETQRFSPEDARFAVIDVAAQLDQLSGKRFGKEIARAAAKSDGVVINLLNCNGCDSASLAMMANQKYVMREGLQFVVAGSGAVRRAFEVTGLSGASPMHATVSSALGTLRSARKGASLSG